MSIIRTLAALAAVVLLLAACGRDLAPTPLSSQLAGENQNPPVATAAFGDVDAVLTGNTLVVTGSFNGLMSDLLEVAGSSAHVHSAPAGQNGPIVDPLVVTTIDERSGQLAGTLILTDEQLQAYEDGDFYVNIHTVDDPSGELRAQLADDAPTFAEVTQVFDASLLPENEVHDVLSGATGFATGVLRADDTLTVSGSFANLESTLQDAGPAHIHEAPSGEDGPVVFPLDVVPGAAMTSGRFSVTTDVTADQIETLLAGGMYVNVHTTGYPAGEVRGQLFPTTVTSTTTLSGDNEVPVVETGASGTATATMDGFDLSIEGTFESLVGDFTAGHIHFAPAGSIGGVVFPLQLDVDGDLRGGTYTVDTVMSESERVDFLSGNFYVNIHSAFAPTGEIRGQFDEFDFD